MKNRSDVDFYAKFLGGFSLNYKGEELHLSANLQSKSSQLFLMLLKAGSDGVERKVLLDLIRPDEMDQKKRMNNFRQQIHILRKIIARSKFPEGEYIVSKGSRYYFSLAYCIGTDTKYLDELTQQLKNEYSGGKNISQLCIEYCQSYTGEFLPMLGGEEWAAIESAYYHKWYFTCLTRLCEKLKEQGKMQILLELCMVASQIHPYDEWQAVQIECLMSLNRYWEAQKVYEEAMELYYKDLGITSLDRVMARYQNEDSHTGYLASTMAALKEGLVEKEERDSAYYCGYPSFLDVYHIVTRIGERTGARQVLLLCTMENSPEILPELEKKMLLLRQVLLKSIRKGDVYTRYSKNQYLALLIGAKEEDKEVITLRLEENWRAADKEGQAQVKFIIQEVEEQASTSYGNEKEGNICCACR